MIILIRNDCFYKTFINLVVENEIFMVIIHN